MVITVVIAVVGEFCEEPMYNIEFFQTELGWIKDATLRLAVRSALEAAPAWFWTAPSSSSGKWHPVDSNGEGGLCRHTAKGTWLVYKYAECFGVDSDILVSAFLLHDWRKFGPDDEMESGRDRPHYKRHAELGADELLERFPEFCGVGDQEPPSGLRHKWEAVCSLIRSHDGKWGTCQPYTLEQKLVHIADVTAAHKELVAVKFYDPDRPVEAPVETNYERLIEKDGEVFLNFGKNSGKSIKSIIENDTGYADWILSDKYDKEDVKEAFVVAMEECGEMAASSGRMPSFSEI